MPLVSRPAAIGRDPAFGADAVDRAQVVHVAFFHRKRVGQIHAERRAEELRLDVVHGERVAGVQSIDVARGDQPFQIFPRARVHDCGAADEQHALAGRARREQFARDLGDQRFLRLLARHGARHEFEYLLAPGPLQREDAHAFVAHDHRVARAHVGRRHRRGAAARKHDRAVHLRQRDVTPAARDTDFRIEVRRRVEIVGEHAVGGSGFGDRVAIVRDRGADVAQFVEEVVEMLARVRFDAQPRRARFGRGLAHRKVIDRVTGELVVHDDLEHATEDARVQDVTAQLDLANEFGRAVSRRIRHWV